MNFWWFWRSNFQCLQYFDHSQLLGYFSLVSLGYFNLDSPRESFRWLIFDSVWQRPLPNIMINFFRICDVFRKLPKPSQKQSGSFLGLPETIFWWFSSFRDSKIWQKLKISDITKIHQKIDLRASRASQNSQIFHADACVGWFAGTRESLKLIKHIDS